MGLHTHKYRSLARLRGWGGTNGHTEEDRRSWGRYEAAKKELRDADLTSAEYEQRINDLTNDLNL